MKICLYISIAMCFMGSVIHAQTTQFSASQKIGPYNHFNVLGATSSGVLVHQYGKGGNVLEMYNRNMTLLWRKSFPLHEKNLSVTQMDVYNDTLRVIYTGTVNTKTYLRSILFDAALNPLTKPVSLDSFDIDFPVANEIDVRYQLYRQYTLVYYNLHNFSTTHSIPYIILNSRGIPIKQSVVQASIDFKSPSLSDGFVFDATGTPDVCFVYGEYAYKNSRNDFPFSKYGVTITSQTKNYILEDNKNAFSSGDYKWDYTRNRLILCGLYAAEPGNATTGIFFASVTPGDSGISKTLTPISSEARLQLSGEIDAKKQAEPVNFKTRALTVRTDGGCILACEQIYESTETFRNAGMGYYGVATVTTLNFYHYNDIMLVSIAPDGTTEWTKVLHKKQESEGDNGYFLSYTQGLGEKQMVFMFNDGNVYNASFSQYTLQPNGTVERHEWFNNEQKGVLLIPQYGKQVTYNEIVIPSIRKNLLQFVKFVL